MDNLSFLRTKKTPTQSQTPLKSSYEHATKTILILDETSCLHFLTYSPESMSVSPRAKTEPIQELQQQNVVLLEYVVETEVALVLTENGAILTVSEGGVVDVKAQNDDGITGGSVSPTQEYVYVVTKNNTLIQLDMEFDLVKEVPLDDHQTQKVDSYDPRFSWKVDGSFFAINILTNMGRKCHTRDNMLGIFRSPSKSDPQPDGVVQSVSQKSRLNMTPLVAWQPSAGIIAGADYINKAGKKVNRVIFWQKNGLRHLQFQLPPLITDVLNLTWSPDSSILCVQVLLINSQRWLYLYHRSNYHWHLKHTLNLQTEDTKYFLIKHKHNQLLTIDKHQLSSHEYVLRTTQTSWKTEKQEQQHPEALQVSVDGHVLKVTDFAQGIVPPPMCHFRAQFQGNLHGVALWGDRVLVVTEKGVYLCKWNGKDLNDRVKLQVPAQLEQFIRTPINFRITHTHPQLTFTHSNQTYQTTPQNTIIPTPQPLQPHLQPQPHHPSHRTYTLPIPHHQPLHLTSHLADSTLHINSTPYIDQCTSYAFYRQFLVFVAGSAGMYDKMFVLDLELDWLNGVGVGAEGGRDGIRLRLEEMESRKLLNYRAVERGAKIITCSKNRIIMQLPRGNLQTISPKPLTLKQLPKSLTLCHYLHTFQQMRTHKLDLNLLYDLDPEKFTQHAQELLTGVGRIDYLNLFVSQLRDEVSGELEYCRPRAEVQGVREYVQVGIGGRKVREVCGIVSKVLRVCDKEKYIMTIFTSDIKMGLLDDVLFQIKTMKKTDIQQPTPPPHLQQNPHKPHKKPPPSSQQLLQYISWLVDPTVLYESSLLTYDLDLASMTARCTQMDPKEYIPYLEELRGIGDPLELRKRICMDLKRYERLVGELAGGSEEQVGFAVGLVEKYKLYKCGLKVYANNPPILKQIKHLIIQQLLSTNEHNQAYNLSLSISAFDKALQIALQLADGRKVRQAVDCMPGKGKEEKIGIVRECIRKAGDGWKKGDLAELMAYVGDLGGAVGCYLQAGNYQEGYRCYLRIPQQQRTQQLQKQLKNAMTLLQSLQKNHLLKSKQSMLEKSTRLSKLHKQKSIQGPSLVGTNIRNAENDDLYSEVSVSSRAVSQYTVSTTTGLRRKKDKKRSILSRNVKEGSPLEEEYLVAFLVDLQDKVQPTIKQTKQLIQHLIYTNLIEQAQQLRNTCREYAQVASKIVPKFYAQVKFEADHPEYLELLEVYENRGILERGDKGKERRDRFSVDSFNYLF